MSDKSSIEWLDGGATWNPTRGCTPIAPECGRCYARTFAERFRGVPGHPFEQGFDPRTVPDALDLPLRWRKPRRIFVNSVSDLFHDAFPDEYVIQVFDVIRRCHSERPGHAFVVLTKRAARMQDFCARLRFDGEGEGRLWLSSVPVSSGFAPAGDGYALVRALTNLTLGVSIGTRARLGDLELLRATPAAARMLSAEPLLEELGDVDLRGIDLCAIGGESGPRARPCDLRWIRNLVARCRAAGCAPFVKQLGAHPLAAFYDHDARAWFEPTGCDWMPEGWDERDGQPTSDARVRLRLNDRKGGDPDEWPLDLRVREMPEVRR